MNRLKRIEEFIVAIEDSTSLLKLYLQRVARSPGNLAYCQAMAGHATEIRAAVETLDNNISHELTSLPKPVAVATVTYVEYLVELAALIDDLTARMAAGLLLEVIQAIDLMREAIAAQERIVTTLSQAESADHSDTVNIIAKLQILLYGEPLINLNTAKLPPAPTVELENDFDFDFEDDEDPFDEIAVGAQLIDEIVGDFDSALDAIVQPDAALFTAANAEADYHISHDNSQLQELFATIAASYLQPVKSFIIELGHHQTSKEWIDICRPALEAITRAAESMNYTDLTELLDRFDALLMVVAESEERMISIYVKQEILDSYAELAAAMPQAFALAEDSQQELSKREGIIINSLLKQVKSVGPTTIRKLFNAGMTTLESFYHANQVDLAAVSGIRSWLAERICERFRQYRREQESSDHSLAKYLHHFHELIEELKRNQFLFKKATIEEWYSHEGAEHKIHCRKQRQQTMWKINLALAEDGSKEAMDLIKELRKHVFERRIEYLQNYLDQINPEQKN